MIVNSHYSLQISELLYYSVHFVSSVVKRYHAESRAITVIAHTTTILLLIVNWSSLVAQQ